MLDNIIFSLQRGGGISVYWRQLLQGLLETEAGLRCLERRDGLQNHQRALLSLPPACCIPEKTGLPLRLARYLPCCPVFPGEGIFHSSYYRTIRTPGLRSVVTVYDCVYERFNSGLRQTVHRLQKQQALQQAHRIICISEHTRRDLLSLYPHLDPERIQVIPLAANSVFQPLPDGGAPLPQLDGLPWQRYLLYVGDRSSYKNFPAAVETVACLADTGLVAIGGKKLNRIEVQTLNRRLAGRFLHLTSVPETELNRLYNRAFCLLYPSGYEGFGIPPLEALQAGCPVVALRTASLPEVCGDAALLADQPEPEQLALLLRQLEQPSLRGTLRQRGFEQAARFSWHSTVAQTRACYQAALAAPPLPPRGVRW